jgi:putative transposase
MVRCIIYFWGEYMGGYNPDIHHRQSIRLKHYDYSQHGAYFVTICVQDKQEMFGTIDDGVMRLNKHGEIAQQVWESLPTRFPGTDIDYFVVMPNHFHGIIVRIDEIGDIHHMKNAEEQHISSLTRGTLQMYANAPQRWQSLGEIVRTFKAATCRNIHKEGCTEFVWQRNYYESIVRNDEHLHTLRNYIVNNPNTWHKDTLNPTS